MITLRQWPTLVAILALLMAGGLWLRLEALSNQLEETRRATAGLAVQAAVVDGVLSGISEPLVAQLDPVVAELDDFAMSTIAIPIDIDQSLPIDTTITFRRTIDVPIQTSIPINETFDTTITVQGPFDIDIDVDVTVPIDVEVPVDLVVPIEIDEEIPVRTTVPVRLSFPIEFDVAGTPLADLATALRDGLKELADAFR